MVGRVLGVAFTAVLTGLLVAGCGIARGGEDPEEIEPTPDLGRGTDDDPVDSVSNDEVIVVVDDGAEVHEDCANREVVVKADDALVILDGDCGLVRATGRNSVVEVGTAEKIVLVGVDNQVSFASGDPEVVNHGRNTTVSEGGTASPEAR
ncbi:MULTISPECIES: DUF3060 domain-containing protein [unclassified Nocardiopsis]|uniref:DUF3060 domain-containing protein n=1 Tax=unclassified Nocardiopsis TaxID=2649073 RepID=UPI00340BDBB3